MIRRRGLDICLLGFLILFAGCGNLSKTTLKPGSPGDLPGCYAIFPSEPWESVHRLEATIGEGSFSLLGVTKGESTERRLQSLLLSAEGFILFDAELSGGRIALRKAVNPFNSPAFARGLMEDVSLLFLPPQVKPTAWGKEKDGTMICTWEGPDESHTEISGSMESGWKILRRNKQGKVLKKAVLHGPFVNGLASRVELQAFKPVSYRIRMTLVQTY
jgi:hypothetical protein